MVLIQCYYYVIDIDISYINRDKYHLVSTNTYIDNNEVFEIRYIKNFFKKIKMLTYFK